MDCCRIGIHRKEHINIVGTEYPTWTFCINCGVTFIEQDFMGEVPLEEWLWSIENNLGLEKNGVILESLKNMVKSIKTEE